MTHSKFTGSWQRAHNLENPADHGPSDRRYFFSSKSRFEFIHGYLNTCVMPISFGRHLTP
eukprot:scaffold74749_cov35-Cyclotella_meneghiniana.AAC.2